MLAAMRERCDLIYDPSRDFDRRLLLQLSPDPLLKGQERAVQGMLKLLKEPDRTVLLLGETGVGKTRMALTTAYCQMGGRGKLFVVCPTAIIVEWKREVALAFPDAMVHVLETVDDVDSFAHVDATDTFVVGVMSKEQAKLGHEWEGVPTCPTCGAKAKVSADKLAERRACCEAVRFTPKNDAARVLTILAQHLGHAFREFVAPFSAGLVAWRWRGILGLGGEGGSEERGGEEERAIGIHFGRLNSGGGEKLRI
jgi:hypothetical protein